MPTYEYKCKSCGHLEEVFAKMSDPPPAACEECGSVELVKVLFPVAVHYKGSGFYNTDYGSKKSGPSGGSGESTGASEGSSGDSGGGSSDSSSSGSGSEPSKPASPPSSSSDA